MLRHMLQLLGVLTISIWEVIQTDSKPALLDSPMWKLKDLRGGTVVKNLLATQEMRETSPGGLQSMGVARSWTWLNTHTYKKTKIFFFVFIFIWRIIALQCVDLCHTTTWISHKCTYVPSLMNLLLPPDSTPLVCHRVLDWAPCAQIVGTEN